MRYLIILVFILISCNNNNIKQIEKKTFYESGRLKSIYHVDQNNDLSGKAQVFYENGNLKSSSTFKKGKLIGVRNYYKDNEENTLEIISLEINDSLRHVTLLFESGMKGQEGYQLGQKRIGKWFIYNSDGILTDTINYGGKVPKFNLKE